MRFESKVTVKGNIGMSYVSQESANAQAVAMDENGCTGCTDCTGCTGCKYCKYCKGCTDCKYFVDGKLVTSPEQQVKNLDKVREIILDSADRLDMGYWHGSSEWMGKTCAEEAVCGTTHCLAGWLQVCSTDKEIREMEPEIGGAFQAPVAAKLFYSLAEEVIAWLRDREYVKELGVEE